MRRPTTRFFGRCNNPWNLTRTPGGSTGRGAAAVAAGLSPLELGRDIEGGYQFLLIEAGPQS